MPEQFNSGSGKNDAASNDDGSEAPSKPLSINITKEPQDRGEDENSEGHGQAPQHKAYVTLKAWMHRGWAVIPKGSAFWSALASVFMAITTGFYTHYARRQWQEMQSSSGKTDDLIHNATEQAKATNALAVQAKRSADAAAESLDAVRANFYRDQRPWVFVSASRLSSEPEENKQVTVTSDLVNTGRSPAIDGVNQAVLVPLPGEIPYPFTRPEQSGSRFLLAPGPFSAAPPNTITKPITLSKQQIDLYHQGSLKLYLFTRISYNDPYGRPHWTTVCTYHVYAKSLAEWTFCLQGNAVDHDDEPSQSRPAKPN